RLVEIDGAADPPGSVGGRRERDIATDTAAGDGRVGPGQRRAVGADRKRALKVGVGAEGRRRNAETGERRREIEARGGGAKVASETGGARPESERAGRARLDPGEAGGDGGSNPVARHAAAADLDVGGRVVRHRRGGEADLAG